MKNYRSVIILLIASLILSSAAGAWRISRELQQELEEKKAAVTKEPDSADALFDLAVTQAYTNYLIDGMSTIKKIPEADPTYKEKALTKYIILVTEKPGDWKLRFRLAFAYYFNDDRDDAIREFENVLKIDPYNVWAYGYLALLYGEIGDVDKAMETTRAGLKIDSNVAALHLLLSEGYYKKGDAWNGFFERMEALRLKALGY
ncbi:MAG: tetratricopeptide repeat protein [Candidatus Saganbacteria bacterium]|nr:tetratricopeptide repeat protein [Candidatus Saganbacteria bacterium]